MNSRRETRRTGRSTGHIWLYCAGPDLGFAVTAQLGRKVGVVAAASAKTAKVPARPPTLPARSTPPRELLRRPFAGHVDRQKPIKPWRPIRRASASGRWMSFRLGARGLGGTCCRSVEWAIAAAEWPCAEATGWRLPPMPRLGTARLSLGNRWPARSRIDCRRCLAGFDRSSRHHRNST